MNEPDQPLSTELLLAALQSALSEPHDAPYGHIMLNEGQWRSVIEPSGVTALMGLPLKLIHSDDMNLILQDAFKANYSYYDYSVYLVPEPHYDQRLMLELDFRFETTRQVESLLRSGKIAVKPCEGQHQYWYTVDVVKGAGCDELEYLICPRDYNGKWHLRGDILVTVSDGDVDIIGSRHTSPSVDNELASVLTRRYGVKVDTAGLRYRANDLLKQAAELEQRAHYFEQLQRPES